MSEERMRVLRLLENGEINVEEATGLLNALDIQTAETRRKNKVIRIIISEDGEAKVNLKVPIRLAKSVARFIPGSALESLREEGIDINELLNSLEGDLEEGELVNINDDGDSVIIKVE